MGLQNSIKRLIKFTSKEKIVCSVFVGSVRRVRGKCALCSWVCAVFVGRATAPHSPNIRRGMLSGVLNSITKTAPLLHAS